jgi:hypothetical protein
VCEDDIALPDDMPLVLDAIARAAPPGWDVVRLVDYDRTGWRKPLSVAPLPPTGRALIRYWQLPMSAGAYAVSSSGAAKLLRRSLRGRGVDADLRRPWQFGLDQYGVHPAPVTHLPEVPSMIGNDRGCPDARRWGLPTLKKWRKSLLKLRQHAYNIERSGLGPWVRAAVMPCREPDISGR